MLRTIKNFSKSDQYRSKIHDLIPGGAHTYSKGDDQFPLLSPAAIVKGKGSRVWDLDGNEFLDCSMGLGSVTLGHAYDPVLSKVEACLKNGVNFQRPSHLEMEMAEKFLSLVPQHDMIKFAKNGSTVVTAAVKLARAYTGKKFVAFPKDHPFYSYDDWFIGKTECSRGVPEEIQNLTLSYHSADLKSLEGLFEKYPGQIACVVSEPEKQLDKALSPDYLKSLIDLVHRHQALFIQDEMVTGFKTGFPGSMSKFGVEPDMATWGKGIANGFSFCALTGKREIMNLGGIKDIGSERVFLISTTHGGETHAIAAAMATLNEYQEKNVIQHIHQTGSFFLEQINKIVADQGMKDFVKVYQYPWTPVIGFKDSQSKDSQGFRTLFLQEMIRRGVLFQGAFVPSFSHTREDILYFAEAFFESIQLHKKALQEGYEKYLVGEPCKPVFRARN